MQRSLAFVLCALAFGCLVAACGGGSEADTSGAAPASIDKLTIVGAGS